jgi:hypothetical protein
MNGRLTSIYTGRIQPFWRKTLINLAIGKAYDEEHFFKVVVLYPPQRLYM